MQSLRGARVGAFVAGLAIAAVIVISSRPASLHSVAGATVTMSVAPTGELGVTPAGTLLEGEDLEPTSAPDGGRGRFVRRA